MRHATSQGSVADSAVAVAGSEQSQGRAPMTPVCSLMLTDACHSGRGVWMGGDGTPPGGIAAGGAPRKGWRPWSRRPAARTRLELPMPGVGEKQYGHVGPPAGVDHGDGGGQVGHGRSAPFGESGRVVRPPVMCGSCAAHIGTGRRHCGGPAAPPRHPMPTILVGGAAPAAFVTATSKDNVKGRSSVRCSTRARTDCTRGRWALQAAA